MLRLDVDATRMSMQQSSRTRYVEAGCRCNNAQGQGMLRLDVDATKLKEDAMRWESSLKKIHNGLNLKGKYVQGKEGGI
jgi:hypothetical protein